MVWRKRGGKLSDVPRQRSLARGLHEWNGAVRIISTMAIGLQRASPLIGRCSIVDVVVVEGVRQGSNSNVLGPDREASPDSDFTCENINNFLLFYNRDVNELVLRFRIGFLMNSLYISSRQSLRDRTRVACMTLKRKLSAKTRDSQPFGQNFFVDVRILIC
jgi:hypothetical protein